MTLKKYLKQKINSTSNPIRQEVYRELLSKIRNKEIKNINTKISITEEGQIIAAEQLSLMGKNFRNMSEAVGVSEWHMSRVMNGKNFPSKKLSEKIADYLGVEYEELWDIIIKEKEVK